MGGSFLYCSVRALLLLPVTPLTRLLRAAFAELTVKVGDDPVEVGPQPVCKFLIRHERCDHGHSSIRHGHFAFADARRLVARLLIWADSATLSASRGSGSVARP